MIKKLLACSALSLGLIYSVSAPVFARSLPCFGRECTVGGSIHLPKGAVVPDYGVAPYDDGTHTQSDIYFPLEIPHGRIPPYKIDYDLTQGFSNEDDGKMPPYRGHGKGPILHVPAGGLFD